MIYLYHANDFSWFAESVGSNFHFIYGKTGTLNHQEFHKTLGRTRDYSSFYVNNIAVGGRLYNILKALPDFTWGPDGVFDPEFKWLFSKNQLSSFKNKNSTTFYSIHNYNNGKSITGTIEKDFSFNPPLPKLNNDYLEAITLVSAPTPTQRVFINRYLTGIIDKVQKVCDPNNLRGKQWMYSQKEIDAMNDDEKVPEDDAFKVFDFMDRGKSRQLIGAWKKKHGFRRDASSEIVYIKPFTLKICFKDPEMCTLLMKLCPYIKPLVMAFCDNDALQTASAICLSEDL